MATFSKVVRQTENLEQVLILERVPFTSITDQLGPKYSSGLAHMNLSVSGKS